ncbi:caspase family protein [Prosthecomicrobium sp. N25]|uniref:caspase family protein n=1 Tax=Prosthecomicrobium sp. N25 TaxID=3129254 RepID=UPI0030768837
MPLALRPLLARCLAGGAACLVVAAAVPAGAETAPKRVALVLGNGAYKAQPALPGAVADAQAVAAAVRRLGFEVIEATDLDRRRTEETLARFYRAVDGAEVAFVYYSGHALQVGGRNLLLPVDAALAGPYDLDFETVPLAGLMDYLAAHARRRMLVIDAARANRAVGRGFVSGSGEMVTAGEGLAPLPAGENTLALAAAAPGRLATAPAGPGGGSALTAALLAEIGTADRGAADILARVAEGVRARTGGRDEPALTGTLPPAVRLAERRALEGFKPVYRVLARRGEPLTPMDMPVPAAPGDPSLALVFERMPATGEIVRLTREAAAGGPVWPGDRIRRDDSPGLGFRQQAAPPERRLDAAFRVEGALTRPAQGRIEIELTDDEAAVEASRRRRTEEASAAAAAIDDFARRNPAVVIDVPVGVGPRPIPVEVPLAGTGRGEAEAGDGPRAGVDRTPEAGRLAVGGVQVAANGAFPLSGVGQLTFEAPVGAEGSTSTMTLAAAGGGRSARAEVTIRATVTDCDRLAGDRLDRQGIAGGVFPNEIDPQQAVAACRADIARYGEIPRFRLQLGRALFASRDAASARLEFQRAADLGHARAYYYLGYLEGVGAGGTIDNAAANALFRKGADLGDVYATYSIGKSTFYGRGLPRDPKRGLELLMASTEGGHTYGMNELGAIFERGDGVKRDLERARRWYEAAAALGDTYGLHNLGLLYLNGKGVPKDLRKARELFEKAAAQGHAAATNELGRLFFNGWGVPKDVRAAADHYRRAAELGEPYAAYSYAWILGTGALGGGADEAGAARYLALSVAVQIQPRHDIARDARTSLARLPARARLAALAEAVRRLDPEAAGRIGASRAELDRLVERLSRAGVDLAAGADLDEVLIGATRAAWLKDRPRLDTF